MKVLERWLEILISGCLLVVVVATFLQVLFRFVFKIPAPWTEEITRIAFVDMVFLGAALAVKHHQHLSVDVINQLPAKLRSVVVSVGYLFSIAFVAILTYYGWVHSISSKDEFTPTLEISTMYLYLIIPVSGIIMLFYLIQSLISEWRGTPKGVQQ